MEVVKTTLVFWEARKGLAGYLEDWSKDHVQLAQWIDGSSCQFSVGTLLKLQKWLARFSSDSKSSWPQSVATINVTPCMMG